MQITKTLKELRLAGGKRQLDVAEYLNMSKNGYASWEQGLSEPNIVGLTKLATLYSVSVDYLLGIEDDAGVKNNPGELSIKEKPLSEKERYIVQLYRQLIPIGQKLAISYLENMQEVNSIPKSNKNIE